MVSCFYEGIKYNILKYIHNTRLWFITEMAESRLKETSISVSNSSVQKCHCCCQYNHNHRRCQSSYYAWAITISLLQASGRFINQTYFLHFVDEKTEFQVDQIICPKSYCCEKIQLNLNLTLSNAEVRTRFQSIRLPPILNISPLVFHSSIQFILPLGSYTVFGKELTSQSLRVYKYLFLPHQILWELSGLIHRTLGTVFGMQQTINVC